MSEYIYSFDGVTEQGIETYMRREEIVRCRDCEGKDYCEAYQDYKNPNGFCAWGERKVDA